MRHDLGKTPGEVQAVYRSRHRNDKELMQTQQRPTSNQDETILDTPAFQVLGPQSHRLGGLGVNN